jgi:hypothetical protein
VSTNIWGLAVFDPTWTEGQQGSAKLHGVSPMNLSLYIEKLEGVGRQIMNPAGLEATTALCLMSLGLDLSLIFLFLTGAPIRHY